MRKIKLTKFLKENLKTIIAIIITTLLVGGTTAFASYNYFAKDVEYKKAGGTETSVEDALNELYKNKNLKIIKVNIGSSNSASDHTFDVKVIPNYKNLTIDNFSLENVYITCSSSTSLGADTFNSSQSNFSYDSENGQLTVYASRCRWMAYGNTEYFGYNVVCKYLGVN